MIPTAPFTPVGVTMSQCPIRILDCRLNSRIPLFHWSLTPTGVKDAVGRIFDMNTKAYQISLLLLFICECF